MPISFINMSQKPQVAIWKLNEGWEELLSMLGERDEYASFLERVSGDVRRCERFASRLLLREILGYEPSVSYRPSGAPYITGSLSHISISHTKGFVAVAVDDHPTGIDIEYMSDRVKRIRGKFMSESEERYIDPQNEIEHLLLHWCAKETLFKVIGEEGVDFRKHLHVEPFAYSGSGAFVARESITEAGRSYRFAFNVTPEYVLTYSMGEL